MYLDHISEFLFKNELYGDGTTLDQNMEQSVKDVYCTFIVFTASSVKNGVVLVVKIFTRTQLTRRPPGDHSMPPETPPPPRPSPQVIWPAHQPTGWRGESPPSLFTPLTCVASSTLAARFPYHLAVACCALGWPRACRTCSLWRV